MSEDGAKKKLAMVGAVALVVAAFVIVYFTSLKEDASSDLSSDLDNQVFIDVDGQTWKQRPVVGQKILNPKTGKAGHIAEACWWTADGKVRDQPVWVLLNEHAGKAGPTFCPDCQRRVVNYNPSPKVPGVNVPVPPTKSEFESRR